MRITNLELSRINKMLEKYIKDYYERVSANNAQQVIDEFDDNWETIIDYLADETPDRQSKYGLALVVFSVAIYESPDTREQEIIRLRDLINRYDTNKNVKYKFGVKTSLFFNLGSCWHKLGELYDSRAVEHSRNTYITLLPYQVTQVIDQLHMLLGNARHSCISH